MRLLALGILLDVVAVVSGLMQQSLLTRAANGVQIEEAEASVNDLRQQIVSLAQLGTFVATAVMWLLWSYRAYSNLGLMGTGRTDYRPRWAVGYWFLPLLNLFRPYQITKELWQRSEAGNASEWVRDMGTPALLGWWWLAWLLSSILGQAVARAAFGAEGLAELQSLTTWEIVDSALSIVAALLALSVVRAIDRLQAQAAADPSATVRASETAPAS